MVTVTHPTLLVETAWVATHLDAPDIRLIEVDLDPEEAYAAGHVPGAVLWSVWGDLLGPDERIIDDATALSQLLSHSGAPSGGPSFDASSATGANE